VTGKTPNQVVAYNLRRARNRLGLTQEEAAQRLAAFLGREWSKATFSANERSWDNADRVKEFTADDLAAMAQAFEVPITYFFVPPGVDEDGTARLVVLGDAVLAPQILLELAFGTEGIRESLDRFFGSDSAPPIDWDTKVQKDAALLARLVAGALIQARLGELETWRRNLLDLAGLLSDVHEGADAAVIEAISAAKSSRKAPKRGGNR
jgi:transcriptional regulator with XRE-family HTH domain